MEETIQTQFGIVTLPSAKKQKTEAELRREEHLLRDYASMEHSANQPNLFEKYVLDFFKGLLDEIRPITSHFYRGRY